jgi:hypothetical protein
VLVGRTGLVIANLEVCRNRVYKVFTIVLPGDKILLSELHRKRRQTAFGIIAHLKNGGASNYDNAQNTFSRKRCPPHINTMKIKVFRYLQGMKNF